jgi:DNA-binding LacI/PurR family transcriptional regulator
MDDIGGDVKRASIGRHPNGWPTMEDVAREAGVSRALVSLVMRGSHNVSQERRQRVLDVAGRIGYRPNILARNLAQRRTSTIGVLINDLHNPFFAEIVDGVEDAASAHGYRLLLSTANRKVSVEQTLMGALIEHRVDGIILLSPRAGPTIVAEVARTTPTVVVGKAFRQVPADFVLNDEMHGAALAVDHLVSLGWRQIVHVDGGPGAGASQRRAGYLRAMAGHGLTRQAEVIQGDFTEEAGVAAAKLLLNRKRKRLPEAVFAANDLVAAGVLDAMEEAGVRVPGDLSIVGYDNTFLAALAHMSLTTVNQPREEMGRMAVQLLLKRIEEPAGASAVLRVTPNLVVRRTTGPAPSPS